MSDPIVNNYVTPLLKFASKSPRYADLLAAAYKLGQESSGSYVAAPNRQAELMRAFSAFAKIGAPMPKEIADRGAVTPPPFTGEGRGTPPWQGVTGVPPWAPQSGQATIIGQQGSVGPQGSDLFAAYRARPAALEMEVTGGPGRSWVGGRGPRTIPIDANGMVEVTMMGGRYNDTPMKVKIPWQQATSMNLGANWQTSMAQGTPTGSGFYPVRAIYAPGQSPFVNVAEPMAPPPPAPLPAAPARVPVNLGGPGPFPGGRHHARRQHRSA